MACPVPFQPSWKTFVVLLALTVVALHAESASPLTLEETLNVVQRTNINVLLGRESVAQAVAAVTQNRARILPIVDGGAQQGRTKSVSTAGNGGLTTSGPTNRFEASLSGRYAVLDFFQLSAVRSARVGVRVAEADFNFTVQSVMAGVAETYFTHLRNVKRIDVLDSNIARAKSLLNLARNQASAGVATKIDVTRAEAALALADQARLQQDTVVYQSAQQLQRQLDINPAQDLALADFIVRRVPADENAIGLDKTAFEQRADWLRGQEIVEQSKVDVRTVELERLPALALSGEYGLVSRTLDESDHKSAWFAGATLSVPIFDAFRIGANRRIALSRQRSQELRLHNLELQITAEVRLALQDAGSRFKQIAVAETTLRLAEEELRLAQQRYEQGVADNREIIDAQNSLAVASDNLNEAVYQYNLSRVELARTRGEVRGILAEKS